MEKVLREEVAWAGKNRRVLYRQIMLELGFHGIKQEADPASIAQPLVLTAGESQSEIPPLRLWGKIDRVDIDREWEGLSFMTTNQEIPPQAEGDQRG